MSGVVTATAAVAGLGYQLSQGKKQEDAQRKAQRQARKAAQAQERSADQAFNAANRKKANMAGLMGQQNMAAGGGGTPTLLTQGGAGLGSVSLLGS